MTPGMHHAARPMAWQRALSSGEFTSFAIAWQHRISFFATGILILPCAQSLEASSALRGRCSAGYFSSRRSTASSARSNAHKTSVRRSVPEPAGLNPAKEPIESKTIFDFSVLFFVLLRPSNPWNYTSRSTVTLYGNRLRPFSIHIIPPACR